MIGLIESRNNLKSGRPEVLLGNFGSTPKPPLIFRCALKKKPYGKGKVLFRKERERGE